MDGFMVGAIVGIFIGVVVALVMAAANMTGDNLIQGGGEFYLKGRVYVCEVVHDLKLEQ